MSRQTRRTGGGDPVVEADASLDGRSTYTVFAVDFPEDISLLAVKDAGAPPRGDDDDSGRGPDDNPGRGPD
jgi:hypothetical protein